MRTQSTEIKRTRVTSGASVACEGFNFMALHDTAVNKTYGSFPANLLSHRSVVIIFM